MKMKQKIILIIAALVFVLAVILNITLLCTDVFPGTYRYSDDAYIYKIEFFDNTYSEKLYAKHSQNDGYSFVKKGDVVSSQSGFYQYIPKHKYSEAEYNTLILEPITGNGSGSGQCKRNSVFSFTAASVMDDSEATYTCGTAIFLQVFYALLMAASIALFAVYRPKKEAENT